MGGGPDLRAPILLADEINRAAPRTQRSLLEAMAEGPVTADGETWQLPQPFFVIATQNPHQFQGTYPLPEGQLDRFMISTSIGYPGRRAELDIVRDQIQSRPLEEMEPVVDAGEMSVARELVRGVQVHEEIVEYAESTAVLEESGIAREPHETPDEYARRYAEKLRVSELARLGEIYLYARSRDAIPLELVEEFDRLEPVAQSSIEKLKETEPVRA